MLLRGRYTRRSCREEEVKQIQFKPNSAGRRPESIIMLSDVHRKKTRRGRLEKYRAHSKTGGPERTNRNADNKRATSTEIVKRRTGDRGKIHKLKRRPNTKGSRPGSCQHKETGGVQLLRVTRSPDSTDRKSWLSRGD